MTKQPNAGIEIKARAKEFAKERGSFSVPRFLGWWFTQSIEWRRHNQGRSIAALDRIRRAQSFGGQNGRTE